MKSSTTDAEFTIGELAQHFGLATHVLRHWEATGLLSPRRVNGRRRYDHDSRTRVAVILHGKQIGFSLDQLRALLSTDRPADRRTLLEAHRAELDRRIAHAKAARQILDHALDCPAGDFLRCPTFQQLVHRLSDPAPQRPPRPRTSAHPAHH